MDDEVLYAGEDLLRVECGRVSPLLLTDWWRLAGGWLCWWVGCLFGLFLLLFCVVVLLPPSVYCRSMFAGHTKAVHLLIVVLVERDTRFPMSNLIHSRFFVVWTASIPRDPSQPARKKSFLMR